MWFLYRNDTVIRRLQKKLDRAPSSMAGTVLRVAEKDSLQYSGHDVISGGSPKPKRQKSVLANLCRLHSTFDIRSLGFLG